HLRGQAHAPRDERRMKRLAQRWAGAERAARAGLRAGALLGDAPMRALTRLGRRLLGDETVPLWSGALPGPAPAALPRTARDDAASCTHGVVTEVEGLDGIEVLDAIAWARQLLPELEVRTPVATATVHPTCSTRHLGLAADLEALVRAAAGDVHVPIDATCCGMAGDRGLLHPELTAAATRDEAAELAGRSFAAYVSANRTCEIG